MQNNTTQDGTGGWQSEEPVRMIERDEGNEEEVPEPHFRRKEVKEIRPHYIKYGKKFYQGLDK